MRPEQPNLNVLVVSDIHAIDTDPLDDKSVSYFSTRPTRHETVNPFLSIPDILSERKLVVDWILCPGDLADRAVPTCQAVAWEQLHDLKTKLGARELIGTVGNHDVDSRLSYDEFDVKGSLQSLTPIFPGLGEQQSDFFWSRNFATVEEEGVLLLVLNSSAFHGINSSITSARSNQEYEHGRVSDRTIAAIQERLSGKRKPLQILLTHHHIYKNERILKRDYSEMTNGTALLEMLTTHIGGQWIVIHGHQHYPAIRYGLGDSASAIIFSAGSFARRLNELSHQSANQFYHIHFPLSRYHELGFDGCGVCHAWDWVPGTGWMPARGVALIPHRAGFGYRTSAEHLAQDIANIVTGTDAAVDWSHLVDRIPALSFVLPSDVTRAIGQLAAKGVQVFGLPFSGKCQLSKA